MATSPARGDCSRTAVTSGQGMGPGPFCLFMWAQAQMPCRGTRKGQRHRGGRGSWRVLTPAWRPFAPCAQPLQRSSGTHTANYNGAPIKRCSQSVKQCSPSPGALPPRAPRHPYQWRFSLLSPLSPSWLPAAFGQKPSAGGRSSAGASAARYLIMWMASGSLQKLKA